MIDLREINETIDKLLREGTSVKDAERLETLYSLRDRMTRTESVQPVRIQSEYPTSAAPDKPETEFSAACAGLSADAIIAALEDTVQGLQIVAPKAYAAVIRKLQSQKQ